MSLEGAGSHLHFLNDPSLHAPDCRLFQDVDGKTMPCQSFGNPTLVWREPIFLGKRGDRARLVTSPKFNFHILRLVALAVAEYGGGRIKRGQFCGQWYLSLWRQLRFCFAGHIDDLRLELDATVDDRFDEDARSVDPFLISGV